ncbi:MAG: citrate transporter [Clostridia bacterium]|nr:citrate transporter [Clostridia bacterium]
MNRTLARHHSNHRVDPRQLIYGAAIRVKNFVTANTVLVIASVLAIISCFIVKPDAEYLGYFDLKTLTCLFCTLAVICALKNIRFFTIVARKIVTCAGNTRTLSLALVYITFIGSMFLANDMALITFLPLGYISLTSTGKEKYMAPIFILQNIAANLGGMLTPFGNPQNLYIYTKFNVPTGEFMSIMLLPFVLSIVLFTVGCLFIPKEALTLDSDDREKIAPKRTVFYLVLFALSILTVFRAVPYYVCLPVVLIAVFFADKDALKKVDYPLLLTFVAFFLLAGNIARIDAVSDFFSMLLEKNTLLTSILSCQVISNVPSAILLSEFTENYRELLLGVNIGGVGTLISSLASLITFREYTSHVKGKTLQYIGLFSALNFGFLIILTVTMMIVL